MTNLINSTPNASRFSPSEAARPWSAPYISTSSLAERIQAAREQARAMTDHYGAYSGEAAIAWETVEELLAEAAHQRLRNATTFEAYCQEFPDAPEARMYDV